MTTGTRKIIAVAVLVVSFVAARSTNAQNVTIVADQVTVFPVPAGLQFQRAMVAADGPAAAGPAERMVYSNTLGTFGFSQGANQLAADDIATTVPNGCRLRRLEFPVVGRVNPAGVRGQYTVDFAMYSSCPGSVPTASRPGLIIPGTQGQLIVRDQCLNATDDDGDAIVNDGCAAIGPAETGGQCLDALDDDGDGKANDGCPANGAAESDADIPLLISLVAGADVPLENNMWFGVKFSRNNAGPVVGAPALVGFSGDSLDYPGFPCDADFGGFPGQPHASFNLRIFADADCTEAFVGYKNDKPSGPLFNPGPDVFLADDIRLGVGECQMISYEIAVKGEGFYTFKMQNNCQSSDIPLTTQNYSLSGPLANYANIARFTFDPPIPLPRNLWFEAKVNNEFSGNMVISGQQAFIGATADLLETVVDNACSIVPPGSLGLGVHGAINLSITCAGSAPVGACCDLNNSMFEGEAVCRDIPAMNCQARPRGDEMAPGWIEGQSCDSAPFIRPCGPAACCLQEGGCEDLSRAECDTRSGAFYPDLLCGLYGPGCSRPPGICGADSASPCVVSDAGACSIGGQFCTDDTECAGGEHCQFPPGCADPACCATICETDSTCCDVPGWTPNCAQLARTVCEPFNDRCVDAKALYADQPESERTVDLRATTNSSGDSFCCDADWPYGEPGATVWYRFIATADSARIHTCETRSAVSDSILQLYEVGDPSTPQSACETLTAIACNDDTPAGSACQDRPGQSDLRVSALKVGATYYVMLAAHRRSMDAGPYIVDIEMPSSTQFHPHDQCEAALELSGASLSQVFDIVGATANCPPAESCSLGSDEVDVWFKYVPSVCGYMSTHLCSMLGRSALSLTVYEGCNCPMDPAELLSCTRSECTFQPQYAGVVEEGRCYLLRVQGRHIDESTLARLAVCLEIGDRCDISGVAEENFRDCNNDGLSDACNIALGTPDCDGDGWPDPCEIEIESAYDCDANGVLDNCDLKAGTHSDCNLDGEPDVCDVADGSSADCNTNGIPDECDLQSGVLSDEDGDGVPTGCEDDCQPNGVIDDVDIALGTSADCNGDGRPDECGAADSCDLVGLVPWGPRAWGGFGWSVAGDGDRVLVGAPYWPNPDGSTFLFKKTHRGWVRETKLVPPTGISPYAEFGRSVALSNDFAVVGSPLDPNDSNAARGSVYVYVFNGGQWLFQQKLFVANSPDGYDFGRSVAIHGKRILVGSYLPDEAAYVFRYNGLSWEEEARLPGDGDLVALSNDRAVTSSYRQVNIFRRIGTEWVSEASIEVPVGDITSLDLDGDIVAAGAISANDGRGVFYVFHRLAGTWTLLQVLPNPVPEQVWEFGAAVALEGEQMIVGAPGSHFVEGCYGSGRAYMYSYAGGTWTQLGFLCNQDSLQVPAGLGRSVAFWETGIIIGAVQNPDNSNSWGDAFVVDWGGPDCNDDAVSDACAIVLGESDDCDENGIPDECPCGLTPVTANVAGTFPQGCAADCQTNGVADYVELAAGVSNDCNHDAIPDECGATARRYGNQLIFERVESPRITLASDIDGDGDEDIFGAGVGEIFAYLNHDQGRFEPVSVRDDVTAGGFPSIRGAVDADLDGDGDLDYALGALIVLSESLRLSTSPPQWEIEYRTLGCFADNSYQKIEDVELTDLDGDGDPDLVVTCGYLFAPGYVAEFLNDGKANFEQVGFQPVGETPRSLTLFDAEGDGDQDVFVANQTADDFSLLINRGIDGAGNWLGFDVEVRIHVDAGENLQPFSTASGDVDRDGDEDVVVALAGADKVLVFINRLPNSAAGGAILEWTSELRVGQAPLFVMLADLNGDGWLDFATADTGGDTISTAFNRGRDELGGWRGFARPTISPAGAAPVWLDHADLLDAPGVELLVANRDIDPGGAPAVGPPSVAIMAEESIVAFADDFQVAGYPPVLDNEKWSEVHRRVEFSGIPPNPVRIMVFESGWMASRPLDLTPYDSATIRFLAFGGESPLQQLHVEFWDGVSWRSVGFLTGEPYVEDTLYVNTAWFELPAEALHSTARFRLRMSADQPAALWRLDDVTLFVRSGDCDLDGELDLCWMNAHPELDANGNHRPDSCDFDFDGDTDVDLRDVSRFFNCFTGPGAAPPPSCAVVDFLADQVVDKLDFAALARNLTGPR